MVRSSAPATGGTPARVPIRLVATIPALLAASVLGAGLNDTGQTSCFDIAGNAESCGNGAQDGRYGRDAASSAGVISKSGAGAGGFDFTKIANAGGALAPSVQPGPLPGDWACTQDNVTGLTWELKTDSPADLRYRNHAYTWYSTAANNGGDPGSLGINTCGGTLAAYNNQCNTANYILAVNAANLCGHADWRLPTIRELEGIKTFGPGDPAIDTTYFHLTNSTPAMFYFSSNSYANGPLTDIWVMNFSGGQNGNTSTSAGSKSSGLFVILVRSGP